MGFHKVLLSVISAQTMIYFLENKHIYFKMAKNFVPPTVCQTFLDMFKGVDLF